MNFRPLHDRVLVRRVEAEEKTAGGIIIPDTAKEKPQEGEVISVGPGTLNDKGELRAPEPTAITSPSCGFSLAVSGMMIPPAVFSSASTRRTSTRS